MRFRSILLALVASLATIGSADKPITITLLHNNDLHAHIEPTKIKGKTYGGYARLATIIERARATEPNVMLLSGGDTFQGTLFFNTYEGLADLAFMNAVGYNAMAVGNHEFDHGPRALGAFAKLANFPILSANLDFSAEPSLNGVIHDSTVITIGGEKFGIVGATTPLVTNISSPGPTVTLKDLHDSVQAAVDKLYASGVHKIFLVTHIGYNEDQQLVATLHHVDVVVGGHSHTPLGTPDLPGWPKADGPYPTVVKNADGDAVPVLQSWEWGKVFGHITLKFNSAGKLTSWSNAKPIVVDETVPPEPKIASMVAAFERPIAALANQVIGETTETFLGHGDAARESSMGDVIADAMLAATRKAGAVVAFINAGGVRGGLEPGKITYGMLISIQPFSDSLVTLDLTGAELLAALQEGVGGGSLIPSAGSSYKVDGKVTDVIIDGKPLDPAQTYRVTFEDFSANGGDNLTTLKNSKGRRVNTGLLDIDALIDYVKGHNPLRSQGGPRVVHLAS